MKQVVAAVNHKGGVWEDHLLLGRKASIMPGSVDLFRLRRYPFSNDICRFKRLVSGLEACLGSFKNSGPGIM